MAADEASILLIATVGSPEAVVAGVLAARPLRAVLICSLDSLKSIGGAPGSPGVVSRLASENYHSFDSGRIEPVTLPDAQDLTSAVEAIHRKVTPLVQSWLDRGPGYRVIVDFTGGTKCMTVALATVSRLWRCSFQYVGGTERTNDGIGVVVSGKEQIVHFRNPWDVLGFQTVRDAFLFFDHGDPSAASRLVAEARNQTSPGSLKTALQTLHQFLEIFALWDRFQHRAALLGVAKFQASAYSLGAVLSPVEIEKLRGHAAIAANFLEFLQPLPASSPAGPPHPLEPRIEFLRDLIANAKRRSAQGRLDDAVARLYRVFEGVAQWRLAIAHGIASTARVPLSAVPEPLRTRWTPTAELVEQEGGEAESVLKIGLQHSYELLAIWNDPIGRRFSELGLAGKGSPLAARNSSILAHGFRPASDDNVKTLLDKVEALLGPDMEPLPVFPKLTELGRE